MSIETIGGGLTATQVSALQERNRQKKELQKTCAHGGYPRRIYSEPKPSAEDWLLWFYPLVMPLMIIAIGIYFGLTLG